MNILIEVQMRDNIVPQVLIYQYAFSKSKFYKEYHTDKDNFKVVTQKGLMSY